MSNAVRWKAKWIDRIGAEREYAFDAPQSLAVARIDFRLECIAAGEPVPEHFELEEGTVLPTLPRTTEGVKAIPHRPRRERGTYGFSTRLDV